MVGEIYAIHKETICLLSPQTQLYAIIILPVPTTG